MVPVGEREGFKDGDLEDKAACFAWTDGDELEAGGDTAASAGWMRERKEAIRRRVLIVRSRTRVGRPCLVSVFIEVSKSNYRVTIK
jgi:hypothetical protein